MSESAYEPIRIEITRRDGSRIVLTGEALKAWDYAASSVLSLWMTRCWGDDPFKRAFELAEVISAPNGAERLADVPPSC